jgi:prepilin-type N-terminal cleavage/methylation domain-containing protein
VRIYGQPGQISGMAPSEHRQKIGMTLTELLCVIAIIAILVAIYLGAIAKAFIHIKKVLGKF